MLKFWRPGPKGHNIATKNVSVFCNGYNELFVTGQIGMKFGEENVNRCPLLNLNRRILKVFAQGGDFALKPPFLGCFDGSVCQRITNQGLRFSTAKPSIHSKG